MALFNKQHKQTNNKNNDKMMGRTANYKTNTQKFDFKCQCVCQCLLCVSERASVLHTINKSTDAILTKNNGSIQSFIRSVLVTTQLQLNDAYSFIYLFFLSFFSLALSKHEEYINDSDKLLLLS